MDGRNGKVDRVDVKACYEGMGGDRVDPRPKWGLITQIVVVPEHGRIRRYRDHRVSETSIPRYTVANVANKAGIWVVCLLRSH